MGAAFTVARRELAGYFATPVAYVFIVIFLVLSGALTFTLGGFFTRGQADLQPFFGFVPWLFLFLVPALIWWVGPVSAWPSRRLRDPSPRPIATGASGTTR